MDRKEPLSRLYLDYDAVLYDKVEAISTIERDSPVTDRKGFLPLQLQSKLLEFKGQTRFIGGLQQARTERTMNVDCCTNDFPRYGV